MVDERSCLGSIKYTAREVETDSRANRVSVSRRYGGAEGGEARKEARRRSNLVAARGTCDVYTKAGILYKPFTHTHRCARALTPPRSETSRIRWRTYVSTRGRCPRGAVIRSLHDIMRFFFSIFRRIVRFSRLTPLLRPFLYFLIIVSELFLRSTRPLQRVERMGERRCLSHCEMYVFTLLHSVVILHSCIVL